jgi:hypothetical protein
MAFQFVHGGSPVAANASSLQSRQMSANTPMAQPTSIAWTYGAAFQKMQEAMTAVIGGLALPYSPNEQPTGRQWVDGKTIYQVTVQLNQITAGGVSTPHGIAPSIANLVSLAVPITSASYGWMFQGSFTNPLATTPVGVGVYIDQTYVWTLSPTDFSPTTAYALIQYTATNR